MAGLGARERRRGEWRDCAAPFLSSMVAGFAAHMYILTNKIPIDDDISSLFDKGATFVSGRYGLRLMSFILPDISMPWIYGLMSLLLISAAVCVTVRLFGIKNRMMQILLGGLFISFPAETGTLSYMFTSAPYALALLAAVCAAYVFIKGKSRWRWLLSPALLVFSCSIYQAYFAFAASFCVIRMIQRLMERESRAGEVLREGLAMLLMLSAAALSYGASIAVVNGLLKLPVLDVVNREQGLLMRIAVAYSAFLHTLFDGYFAYVNTKFSALMHTAVLLLCAYTMGARQLAYRDIRKSLLLLLCLALLPLSCYCLYMLADNSYIHSLALYPFASVYVLAAVLLGECWPEGFRIGRAAAAAALAAICIGNLYFANSFYLRCELQYENTKAFYTAMLARIMQTEGFDEGTEVAIIGEEGALRHDTDEDFRFEQFQLPGNNITNPIHAEDLIGNYLGMDIPFAGEDKAEEIKRTPEFEEMPPYPYEGSIKLIDGMMVVKLS